MEFFGSQVSVVKRFREKIKINENRPNLLLEGRTSG